MRRGRIFFYLAFIIILGLVAFVIVWQRYLQPSKSPVTVAQPTPVIKTVNVIVVTQQVPRGAAVSGAVLSMIPVPEQLYYQGMFTNIADVEGKLAKFDLEAGVPLTQGMLVESAEQLSSTGSTAALSIPRGMVAVSIPISRLSSVSYAPRPGDHVNVIVAMLLVDLDNDFQTLLPNFNVGVIAPGPVTEQSTEKPSIVAISEGGTGIVGRATQDPLLGQTFYHIPSEEQRPRMVSQNLLQDAIVLQVGSFPTKEEEVAVQEEQGGAEAQPTPEPSSGEEQEAPKEPPPPDVITLIVTPQDAITLNYLVYSGAQLTLALRAAQDDTRVQTESVTLQFLLEQYNITIPAKLPNGMEPPVRALQTPELSNEVQPTPAP